MNRMPGRPYPRGTSFHHGYPGGPSLGSIALGALAVVLVAGAIILALIQGLSTDLPSLEQLETYSPRLITRVLGSDTTVIKEFYTEKRVQVPLDSISPHLVNALLATEDRRFYQHWGIDPIGIMRAFTVNALSMSTQEGASTLTQQLARNLYLHRRQTIRRKLREMITAVQIERTYAKDEILQMYFTQMYWGHGAYGIQSAAKLYFGTSARDLTLAQSATLIGMLRAPNYYSPLRNPQEALRIRNTVLANLLTLGVIGKFDYAAARNEPLELASHESDELGIAPYFTEWVRQKLESAQSVYGFDYYRDGLIVKTTLDPAIQAAAETAVDSHMTVVQRDFNSRFTRSGLYDWLVEAYRDSVRISMRRLSEDSDTLLQPSIQEALVANEDSIRKRARSILADSAAVDSILRKHFEVQVALVAMDPHSGDVLAMVGGRDFHRSKYNRAVQAEMRQPGSVFKPFVYTTAIDNGIYANYRMLNMVQPLLMGDGTWWRPENYNVQNRGEYVSLRDGLRLSLNNVTVRMVSGEDRIVPLPEVIRYARRMGIRSTYLSAVPALALGSGGVVPMEVVAAYGVFAAGGVRSTPRSITAIEDRNGQTIASYGIERETVLSEETSAIMVNLLEGVINKGTGGSARWRWGFRAPAAGKTGTTNNFTDAWFVGFTPHIVAGVWVGFDDPKKSLGQHQSGAVVALPIWSIFMNGVYAAKKWPFDEFELPVGVVEIPVCEDTGMLAGPYCPRVYDELFRRGDEPLDPCTTHRAQRGGW